MQLRWLVVLASWLASCVTYCPAPIQWGGLPAKKFSLGPGALPNNVSFQKSSWRPPQMLATWDQCDKTADALCENKATALWDVVEPASTTTEVPAAASGAWYMVMSSVLLAMLAALGLSSWLWRRKARTVLATQDVPITARQAGVPMVAACNFKGLSPAQAMPTQTMTIFVNDAATRRIWPLRIRDNATVHDLKEFLEHRHGLLVAWQSYYLHGILLDDARIISDIVTTGSCMLLLMLRMRGGMKSGDEATSRDAAKMTQKSEERRARIDATQDPTKSATSTAMPSTAVSMGTVSRDSDESGEARAAADSGVLMKMLEARLEELSKQKDEALADALAKKDEELAQERALAEQKIAQADALAKQKDEELALAEQKIAEARALAQKIAQERAEAEQDAQDLVEQKIARERALAEQRIVQERAARSLAEQRAAALQGLVSGEQDAEARVPEKDASEEDGDDHDDVADMLPPPYPQEVVAKEAIVPFVSSDGSDSEDIAYLPKPSVITSSALRCLWILHHDLRFRAQVDDARTDKLVMRCSSGIRVFIAHLASMMTFDTPITVKGIPLESSLQYLCSFPSIVEKSSSMSGHLDAHHRLGVVRSVSTPHVLRESEAAPVRSCFLGSGYREVQLQMLEDELAQAVDENDINEAKSLQIRLKELREEAQDLLASVKGFLPETPAKESRRLILKWPPPLSEFWEADPDSPRRFSYLSCVTKGKSDRVTKGARAMKKSSLGNRLVRAKAFANLYPTVRSQQAAAEDSVPTPQRHLTEAAAEDSVPTPQRHLTEANRSSLNAPSQYNEPGLMAGTAVQVSQDRSCRTSLRSKLFAQTRCPFAPIRSATMRTFTIKFSVVRFPSPAISTASAALDASAVRLAMRSRSKVTVADDAISSLRGQVSAGDVVTADQMEMEQFKERIGKRSAPAALEGPSLSSADTKTPSDEWKARLQREKEKTQAAEEKVQAEKDKVKAAEDKVARHAKLIERLKARVAKRSGLAAKLHEPMDSIPEGDEVHSEEVAIADGVGDAAGDEHEGEGELEEINGTSGGDKNEATRPSPLSCCSQSQIQYGSDPLLCDPYIGIAGLFRRLLARRRSWPASASVVHREPWATAYSKIDLSMLILPSLEIHRTQAAVEIAIVDLDSDNHVAQWFASHEVVQASIGSEQRIYAYIGAVENAENTAIRNFPVHSLFPGLLYGISSPSVHARVSMFTAQQFIATTVLPRILSGGPVDHAIVGGHSFGCLLASHTASHLEQCGQGPGGVFLLDGSREERRYLTTGVTSRRAAIHTDQLGNRTPAARANQAVRSDLLSKIRRSGTRSLHFVVNLMPSNVGFASGDIVQSRQSLRTTQHGLILLPDAHHDSIATQAGWDIAKRLRPSMRKDA